eukprot:GILI01009047.1.p1 GENE.GILI01009047.1~~GILI01009047.1.p1  ORF type:complete len:832 (+),score=210.56 GILI01009047.1:369-2498(+)
MHPAITLRPITSCPAKQFEDLQNKQPLWNVLIDMLARHPTFLSEVLADTAASDEGFTGKMLAMYRELYLGAGGRPVCYQPNMLGVFRNDYMEEVHAVTTPATYEHSASWKQVEINTISVSFAGLAPKVGRFHQLVGQIAKNEVARRHPTALAPEERIHIGESDKVVPGALAAASRQYLSWRAETVNATPSSAVDPSTYIPVVCFVIQENERNTTDQYMLSLEVEQSHNIRCIRRTLREINESLMLVELPPIKEDGNPKVPPLAVIDGTYEVTLFYFRSSYTPTDFPTEVQWQARHDIEVSAAVKCPSLPYYLCTFKKVQQVITGSRMRSEGTVVPTLGSNSPSARSPTSSMVKEFAIPATPTSEIDHVQQLLSRIQLGAGAPNAECGPTGRRRGAPRKPFAVSAAQFYETANAYADLDQTPRKAAANTEDAEGVFGLTYFSDGGSAVAESQVGWYTNWIRCNFVPIYSLNPRENPNAEEVISDAIANPRNYVLKPQLEGGGNLYSGDEMVTLLRVQRPEGDESTLSEAQKEFLKTYWRVRNEYILMRRIMVKKHSCDEVMSSARGQWSVTGSVTGSVDSVPPLGETPSVLDDDASPLFRMGQIISKSQVRSACIGINHIPNDDLCSELGIYGVILSQGEAPSGESAYTSSPTDGSFSSVVAPTKVNILLNDSAGYVIRSKLASVDDGGVMAGAAFLDSIALRHSVAVAV